MITILTPTYNRAHLLPTLYGSLCRQTSREFEWLVLDDGSSDGTETLVKGWMDQDNGFAIRYIKQKNGGKHRAVNHGVKKAGSDFIFIVDSDDFLTDDAVELVNQWTKTIRDDDRFAGVSGKKLWSDSKMQRFNLPDDNSYIDATSLEREKYHIFVEQAEIYKTAVMKQFPFPEYEGENFIRESSAWDRIAMAGYKVRWYNRSIYHCDYYPDGLTKNVGLKMYAKNWRGYTDCTVLFLQTHSAPYTWIKIGQYAQIGKMAKKTTDEICRNLGISRLQLMGAKMFCVANEIRKKLDPRFDPRGV